MESAPLRESPLPALSRRHAGMLLALCVVLRIVSLVRPCLSDDEAIYAVVGREMLAGHALYRDVVDHKPPAIYLVNAATQAVGGPVGGMVLLHALLIVVVWATGLLLAGIVRRCDPRADERTPWLAALLWIVFTTTLVDTDSLAANCELFMMLPLVGATHVFLGARGRFAHLVGAGALIGVAMLFKYQAGIELPLFAVALLVWQRRSVLRSLLGMAALGVGVALPLLATLGWLAASSALDAAVFWFRFNFAYIDTGASDAQWAAKLSRVGFVLVAAAPLYVLASVALVRTRPPFVRFAIGWLAVSAAAVTVGGRFFGHYFHQLTAPLAVIAAPAAVALWDRHRRVCIGLVAMPAAIFLALGVLHDPLMHAVGEPDPDYHDVIAWLDTHGAPSDSICVWGNSPVLYFEAQRGLGCRFVFANYLSGLSPATPGQRDPAIDTSKNVVPEAWDMLESDLRTRRATFVLDASPGNVGFYGKYPPDKFPRLAHILACDYAPEATVGGLRVYRRLATSRCGTQAGLR